MLVEVTKINENRKNAWQNLRFEAEKQQQNNEDYGKREEDSSCDNHPHILLNIVISWRTVDTDILNTLLLDGIIENKFLCDGHPA